MDRRLVIGDIHGALKALLQVFERAQVQKTDTLIFLGDYVDGWSGSSELISYLIKLKEAQPCIFIKGNHDLWCEDWLRNGSANNTWVFSGGQSTMDSYAGMDMHQKEAHLHFFERMKYFEIDAQNRLFIHAGFTSMHGPQREVYSSNYSWDRTLWETAVAADKTLKENSVFFPKRLKLFQEIFIGHTPTLHYGKTEPMQGLNVSNMDTGAAFTGKLSVMDIDTREFWQSDPVQELYPDETGRNKTG